VLPEENLGQTKEQLCLSYINFKYKRIDVLKNIEARKQKYIGYIK
jgi:hypothetical protein